MTLFGSSDRREHVPRQLAGQHQVQLAPVRPPQVELVQLVANHLRPPLRVVVPREFVVEKLDPPAVDLFRLRCGMRDPTLSRLRNRRLIRHFAPHRQLLGR